MEDNLHKRQFVSYLMCNAIKCDVVYLLLIVVGGSSKSKRSELNWMHAGQSAITTAALHWWWRRQGKWAAILRIRNTTALFTFACYDGLLLLCWYADGNRFTFIRRHLFSLHFTRLQCNAFWSAVVQLLCVVAGVLHCGRSSVVDGRSMRDVGLREVPLFTGREMQCIL